MLHAICAVKSQQGSYPAQSIFAYSQFRCKCYHCHDRAIASNSRWMCPVQEYLERYGVTAPCFAYRCLCECARHPRERPHPRPRASCSQRSTAGVQHGEAVGHWAIDCWCDNECLSPPYHQRGLTLDAHHRLPIGPAVIVSDVNTSLPLVDRFVIVMRHAVKVHLEAIALAYVSMKTWYCQVQVSINHFNHYT